MRQILYILADFQVSGRPHGGPEFFGNYLIDYIIIILITAESKLLLGM